MSDGPRRSARKTKPVQREEPEPALPAKRKAKAAPNLDPAKQLQFLLENSRSKLTKIDLSQIVNGESWDMLTPEARAKLVQLLPQTALLPSSESDGPERLDPAFFSDAHFLAACRTFQDHLYSNWFSEAQIAKVKRYEEGVRDGTLSAPWKDEVWEEENRREGPSSTLAGDAAEFKLVDLVKSGVLKAGDVLVYKRKFTALGVTVEKDVLIHSIDKRTHNLTVLLESGTTRDLSQHLLMPGAAEPQADSTREMTIASPTQLESGILDVDGRVGRAQRPNGNAWKALSVWRWAGDSWQMEVAASDRGGRQDHGTLFYLRACHYQDR